MYEDYINNNRYRVMFDLFHDAKIIEYDQR